MKQCKDMALQYRSGQYAQHHSHETTPHRHREKAHGTHKQQATPEHANGPMSAKKPVPAESMHTEEDQVASQADSDDARDFDSITSFLANGGADNRTDEEVWEMLAKEVCNSNSGHETNSRIATCSIQHAQRQAGKNFGLRGAKRSMKRCNVGWTKLALQPRSS